MRYLSLILFLLGASGPFCQATELDFVGLRSFTEKGLEEAIAGRLDYILDREVTPFRADDAAYLVETYLRSHGLPDATVTSEVLSPKRIRLTIKEGLAQFLGPITVAGIKAPEAVQAQFRAPFPESGKRRAFQADAIESGLARVRNLLHADGYWEARVTATPGTRTATNEIPFTLRVNPGPLFTLATPQLETPVPPSAKLRGKLEAISGETATAEAINSTRRTISESYRRRGYTEISLSMAREFKGTTLGLFFTLTPGQKYTVQSFKTEGLKKTKPGRIENRFANLVGQTYDEDRINAEVKKLLSTGAFESIRLDSVDDGNSNLDLTLNLTESEARGYSFSLGYGSIEGYIIGARYYDRNLWGHLWNLSAGVELTSLGGLGDISLSNPFFLNKELNLANRVFLTAQDFDNYRKLQGGLGSELSWKRGKYYSAALGFELSQTSVNSPLPDDLIGPADYLVNRFNFRQIYNRRDDPNLPSDRFRWYASLENSLGFAAGNGGLGFFETKAHLSCYKTFGTSKKNALALGLRGGLILPTKNDENLPIDLRQFLGGANTLRSFPEREMGPSFGGYALGGTSWGVANAEYTRALAGPVKGLLFLDAANLDSETDIALGLGVRIDLPVGPIRLEYGHSLTRDPGEPSGAFHFAIGTTF